MYSKPILFCDFNGVLSYNKFWSTFSDPEHKLNPFHSKITNFLFVENREIFDDWMIGKYTSEEIHELISKETGIPFTEAFETFQQECEDLDISVELLKIIKELKSKFYCILATGNMDSFNRFTLPNNPLLTEVFDEINNSYDIKMLKTTENGKYFLEKCSELGVDIKDCILIDDSSRTCNAFSNLGGTTYCVSGVNQVREVLDNLSN